MTAPVYLLADVGGTNTRVALSDGRILRADSIERFRNDDFDNIAPVIAAYCARHGVRGLDGAAIDIAGPVKAGVGTLTNRSWAIDEAQLRAVTGAPKGAVINDLQAHGFAVPHVAPETLELVLPGAIDPAATALVINVGTGFNTALVLPDGYGGHIVPPAESGHATLPLRQQSDWDLSRALAAHHGFAAVEDVLSGRGLERLYGFVSGGDTLSGAQIMAQVVENPHAKQTVAQFMRLLGNVAGDLALIHLAFGGIYLVGGVARAMGPHFADAAFGAAFRDKGRFAGFMEQFNVALLVDDYAGLRGCAARLDQDRV